MISPIRPIVAPRAAAMPVKAKAAPAKAVSPAAAPQYETIVVRKVSTAEKIGSNLGMVVGTFAGMPAGASLATWMAVGSNGPLVAALLPAFLGCIVGAVALGSLGAYLGGQLGRKLG